jgi:hypothetical protein
LRVGEASIDKSGEWNFDFPLKDERLINVLAILAAMCGLEGSWY